MSVVAVLLAAAIAASPGAEASLAPGAVPECAAEAVGGDADGDGLTDACEHALASLFAPLLLVRAGGCNWDAESTPARLGGGYLHAVAPVDGRVRIAYMPAYYVDCGWRDRRCSLPFINCAPHAGDSEFIVIELEQPSVASIWSVTGVFLSAHCFGRGASSCRWYRGADLQRFQWHEAAPVVWVAEGRNANYPSWRACNAGHRTMDTCARHDTSYRFPVRPERNIGSRTHPGLQHGCLAGRELEAAAVEPDGVECFWDAQALFRGWQGSGIGVTAYERYLRQITGL